MNMEMEIQRKKLEFENVCHTCLKNGEELNVVNDTDRGDGEDFVSMLHTLSGIEISKKLKFPQKICSMCVQKLRISFNFRELCIKSYRILMENIEEKCCPILDKSTQTVELLEFPCEKCDDRFRTAREVKSHRYLAHQNEPNECRFCHKIFGPLNRLRYHLISCHSENGYPALPHCSCTHCGKQFARSDHLRRHLNLVHNIETVQFSHNKIENINLKEEVEEETFNESANDSELSEDDRKNENLGNDNVDDNLIVDVKQDDSFILYSPKESKKNVNNDIRKFKRSVFEQNFKRDPENGKPLCDTCGKTFKRASHLFRHQRTHTDPSPFSCLVGDCQKRFSRKQNLNNHMASAHPGSIDLEAFECSLCFKKFTRKDHVKRHLEICGKTKVREKNQTCVICNKPFLSEAILARHIRSTHEKTEWKCKYCKMTFASDDEKKIHVKKFHPAQLKQYLCNLCGMGFIRNDYLRNHLRRHTGEKPFKCKYCDKGFPRSTDLNVHEKYHTGEKNHVCDTCGKKFTRSYNLVIHRRVHTGEKPYKCPHCPKRFAQSNDMKAHIRRHTGERFRCELCNEGFIQLYHLTQHKRTVHKIYVPSHIKRLEKFLAPSIEPTEKLIKVEMVEGANLNLKAMESS